MPILSQEFRKMGYYFGGYEDGYYLKFRGETIKSWRWTKPSQEELDDVLYLHIAEIQSHEHPTLS